MPSTSELPDFHGLADKGHQASKCTIAQGNAFGRPRNVSAKLSLNASAAGIVDPRSEPPVRYKTESQKHLPQPLGLVP